MKKIFIIIISSAFLLFNSCETLDLEQVENPSQLTVKFLDPNYTFNYVQLQLPDFVNSCNSFTQDVTRQTAMTGGNTYDNAFAPVNFNGNWSDGYNMLNAIKIMEPKAIENKQYYALGASKVIRVYVMCTLVDIYGDVPFTESLLGVQNLNPKFDSSANIYKQLLLDLDEAKGLLNLAGATGANSKQVQDLYYGGPKEWITLANTIKLKMLVAARLAGSEIGVSNIGNEINSIVTLGNYIDVPSKDFAFKYGNSRFNPNTRHPSYNNNYELGARDYIGNYFLWSMTEEKRDFAKNKIVDPRTAFYFYKQESDPSTANDFILPRLSRPIHYSDGKYSSFYNTSILAPYKVSNWLGGSAFPAGGYWGRDHGDNSGIPQDGSLRTVPGYYPAGGLYSSTEGSVQTSGIAGNNGAGIMPIILSSYVHFMIAESILKAGVAGNAKSELALGITQSIDKTITKINNYPKISADDRPLPAIAEGIYAINTLPPTFNNTNEYDNLSSLGKISFRQKKDYIDFVSDFYDSLSVDKQLELIIKEYYIASWGNGIEPYNNYRRTGFPSNFQPTLELSESPFYYTALYPGNSVNNNTNTPNNTRTKKVFWDKANLNLH